MDVADTETEDVVVERTMDAPVDLVWLMWTVPEHFEAWYGPPGATVRVLTMDLRVGGRRHVAMEMPTPDGLHRMWLAGEHVEIVPEQRIAYTESMAAEDGRILDADEAGLPDGFPVVTQVVVELRMIHVGVPADSPGAAGWNAAMADFAAHLATLTTA
jgi:uncharacterized protein YndB with AHSA1/START domain